MSNTPGIGQEHVFTSPFGPGNTELGDTLESQDLSLRQAIRILRKRKRVVIVTALICAIATLVISLLVRPYYVSTAVIEVEANQSNAMDSALGSVASSLGADDYKVEMDTETSVLKSDDLALETMKKVDYEQHEARYFRHWFGGGRRIPAERGLPLSEAPQTRRALLERFSKNLKVEELQGTRLLQVSIYDPDPQFAARIASTMIDQYVNDRLERRNSSTLQATNWMDGEISAMKQQVDATQNKLIDFQQKSGLLALPSSGGGAAGANGVAGSPGLLLQSPQLDRFTQLNQDLIAAEADRITKEAIYHVAKTENIDALAQMGNSLMSTSPASDPIQATLFSGLMNLRQEEVALKLQIAVAQRTYGSNNPHMEDLNAQLAEIDRQTKVEVKRIVDRAQLDYDFAQKAEDAIRAQYNTELKTAYNVNDSQIHLAVLQEEADSMRALYEDLRTKLLEAKLQIGMQASNIGLISRPLPGAEPVRP
ncbi:MAG: GumC family protein, partial [Terriglobia bacterium]